MFAERYGDVFKGDKNWQGIKVAEGQTYQWDIGSTYVQNPPYFEGLSMTPEPVADIIEARVLGIFGDSITTDHISPAGNIRKSSPAGDYLSQHQVSVTEFNSYGARRGNHEVMMRGTLANIRLRNKITPEIEGGVTRHFPSGEVMPIYDAAMRYKAEGRGSVIFAGKEYGTGSSRDWAAKGVRLLGVRAVIAETFERIHRSNLVGMGVLPLQFIADGWQRLGLTGEEIVTIRDLASIQPRRQLMVELYRPSDGKIARFPVRCRIDTATELTYFNNGGVLNYVLRNLAKTRSLSRSATRFREITPRGSRTIWRCMKRSAVVLVALLLAPTAASARRTMLVELFTAQGCATCNKANSVVARWVDRPGILVLTWSVDYWDYLGWKDTFAETAFADRQKAYDNRFGLRDVSTPQIVVGGEVQQSGDRTDEIDGLVKRARRLSVAPPQIAFGPAGRLAVGWRRRPTGAAMCGSCATAPANRWSRSRRATIAAPPSPSATWCASSRAWDHGRAHQEPTKFRRRRRRVCRPRSSSRKRTAGRSSPRASRSPRARNLN